MAMRGETDNSFGPGSHVVEIKDVKKSFYVYVDEGQTVLAEKRRWFSRKKPGELVAIKSFTLDVDHGEFIALLGPSGCGKSTLLRIIAGFETPTGGTAKFKGELINGPDPKRAMVFQSERAVFPWLTVEGNIGLGPKLQGMGKQERKEAVTKTIELVDLVGFEKAYPKTLSGGMLQRVAVARAIVNHPELLLMDEPFGALDAQTRNNLQDHVIRIWQSIEQTIMFVTHDIEEAVYLANKVVVFTSRPGEIKEVVSVNLPHPRDRTSEEFIGLRNHCTRLIRDKHPEG
ncbi:Nitrate ABC transporter, ATP-binding protein [hydrothermal vent metagenome]|uniref:Nitrate ABC transporter, ATP-binding protein n=1 Tax=hydrothermal vent metagenome TaxID=652676 RepID=A0A3B1BR83_9ZZZZ